MASAADILEFFSMMEPLRLGNAPVFKGDADKIFVARIWANILHDVSLEDIQAAQVVYLGSKAGKWWPTPADIRPLCPSVARAQIAEAPRDLWPAVLRACGSATPRRGSPPLCGQLRGWGSRIGSGHRCSGRSVQQVGCRASRR